MMQNLSELVASSKFLKPLQRKTEGKKEAVVPEIKYASLGGTGGATKSPAVRLWSSLYSEFMAWDAING